MAKVIHDQETVVVSPWWVRWQTALVGVGMGVSWWVLASILRRYVVEPLACKDLSAASVCSDAFGTSASIATIIVAIIGALVLVRLFQPRPIITAVAAGVLLWDLGALVSGLSWWVTLLWGVLLYGLVYGLFSLTARFRTLGTSLAVTLIVIIGIRLLLSIA